MSDRHCKGTNKQGKPCRVAPLKTGDYCRAHDPELPEESRFGSSIQASKASTGVERRFPRLREVLEAKLEENADRIIDAQIEALDATRVTMSEDGSEIHIHPDYATRAKVGDTLLSRALGRPTQQIESNQTPTILVQQLIVDPETRELAAALRRRLADGRTLEPSRLSSSD